MSSKPVIPFLAELLAMHTASYVISQALKAYTKDKPFLETFDVPPFIDFILFNLFKVPVSTAWNTFLDDLFAEPAPKAINKDKADGPEKKTKPATTFSWKSVIYKLILNQTIYSIFINAAIISFMSFRRRSREGNPSFEGVYADLNKTLFPLYWDSLKVWPLINLVGFSCFDTMPRMRFLTLCNLVWSVYVILSVT